MGIIIKSSIINYYSQSITSPPSSYGTESVSSFTSNHINIVDYIYFHIDELFLRELRTEFDQYMSIINILERKAQNLSVISTILITILIGTKILDNNASLHVLVPLSITVGLLLASIVSSRFAAGIHGQVMHINFRQFFILNRVGGEQYSINDDKINQFIIHDSITINGKKSSTSDASQENKSINLQICLINEYNGFT